MSSDRPLVRWAHFSDWHVGNDTNTWADETLRYRLIDFLRNNVPVLDFIIITGDIIDRGQYYNSDHVEHATSLVKSLRDVCATILACPGNHDFARTRARAGLLGSWLSYRPTSDAEERSYADKLSGDFEAFYRFCNKADCKSLSGGGSQIYTSVDGVNIVLLNTSLFAGLPAADEGPAAASGYPVHDDGRLHLTKSNLAPIRETATDRPTIVIGHHPYEMFDQRSKQNLVDIMDLHGAKFYFCGHIHSIGDTQLPHEIIQKPCSGLFEGDFNTPRFSIHEFQKSQNTRINSKHYQFREGQWQEQAPDNGLGASPARQRPVKSNKRLLLETKTSYGAIQVPFNDGIMNVFRTSHALADYISPHRHQFGDEFTYVIKGEIYIYVGTRVQKLTPNSGVNMLHGEHHAVITRRLPCEYLTIGLVPAASNEHETKWKTEIEQLDRLEQQLSGCSPRERVDIYDHIIDFLKAPIMEVRWAALDKIQGIIEKDKGRDGLIESSLHQMISRRLVSASLDDIYLAIDLAIEVCASIQINIDHDILLQILLGTDRLSQWMLTYFLLRNREKLDYASIYESLPDPYRRSEIDEAYAADLQVRALLSVLSLLIDGKADTLITAERELEQLDHPTLGSIPLSEVGAHLLCWYVSFPECISDLRTSISRDKLSRFDVIVDESVYDAFISSITPDDMMRIIQKIADRGHFLDFFKSLCSRSISGQ